MNNIKIKKNFSPKTYLHKYVYDDIRPIIKKKRKKVKSCDFKIVEPENYKNIVSINYNVSQLKQMCKRYKLKVSGNKPELMHRIYNFLKYSYYCIKIQKNYRGYLYRQYEKFKGPGYKNTKLCCNKTDFLLFEEIKNLPKKQLFTYKDKDGFIYGFDICSLWNLIYLNKETKNPYNRNQFPEDMIYKIKRTVHIGNIYNYDINIEVDKSDLDILSNQKKIELKTLDIFQKIDKFGHITNISWFLNLSKIKLFSFLRELIDIWDYRAQITIETKKNIFPPSGSPFNNINFMILRHKKIEYIQEKLLRLINRLITYGKNEEYCKLGALYILGALTMVNNNAANALPWLYDSFMIVH
jgi:hypothetical protein